MAIRGAVTKAHAAIERAAETATSGDELLERVDTELRKHLPYDGATWFGTDPATLLSTSPARIDGIEAGHCETFWEREFLVDDTNLFRDLHRSGESVAALRLATDDRPVRSARYREFLKPQGYDDELRAVFSVGGTTWGITALYRERDRPAFTAEECELVATVVPVIASALRTHVAGSTPWQLTPTSPGLLMFDGGGSLMSTNAEASQWLAEIDCGPLLSPGSQAWVEVRPEADHRLLDTGLPPSIISLVARARAVFEGHEPGPARLRLRSRNGQWLVAHASCMGSSSDGPVTVVIEPAKSTDVAPIIVEAYALSPRERDVVRAIARGLSSAEIAAELYLSPHTVRDYVKSIFEKVGVSSRGELVAQLFADHYAVPLHLTGVHVE
jgi:DNA-binding CsgD family transcriptional regulator